MNVPARTSVDAFLLAVVVAALTCQARFARGDDAAAGEYVHLALAHQAYGKQDISRHFLEAALLVAPDFAPAHWHLGHVQVDGQWVPAADAHEAQGQCDTLAAYCKLRDEALDEPRRELSLARWCKRQGWKDLEQLHYSRVAFNPDVHVRLRMRAGRKLNLVDVEGEILSPEDVEYRQERAARDEAAAKKWRGTLERWEQAIAGDDRTDAAAAAAELAGVDDPAVIPVVRAMLHDTGAVFGQQLVALLGRFPQYDATQVLVRFAVESPWEEVRDAAIGELKQRPLHEFVPLLLDQMIAPVHSQFSVTWTAEGLVRYQHRFIRRAAEANYVAAFEHVVRPFLRQSTTIGMNNWWRGIERITAALESRNQFRRSISQIRRRLVSRERALARQNSDALANNDFVVRVLERTTGEIFGPDPVQWQSWWERYNETETAKPTYYTYYPTSSTYTVTVDPTIRRSSCFAAGTPVWTQAGLVPIESVQVGDRVLSQDLDTGELSYKLVLRTTALPPSSGTVRVKVDAEAIDMTKAHVVWVDGQGWRMAKELADGDRLHGIHGAQRVQTVYELPTQPEQVYNLVVADYNTFFVGESGMLVHDITYVTRRRPTAALVPGYTPGGSGAAAISSTPPPNSIVRQVERGVRQ